MAPIRAPPNACFSHNYRSRSIALAIVSWSLLAYYSAFSTQPGHAVYLLRSSDRPSRVTSVSINDPHLGTNQSRRT
ncbi:hypothetical protein T4B_2485 [Trichinella pseudospiralis]|uniref:Uncharacterized protein n=1 Tax=Trichinella pseudospiralis TaxID=6337 RepID=A0A0V1HGV4_TRIPS|nr:hypothetical protein T4B_2485 [Trichinella pseudospiralis]